MNKTNIKYSNWQSIVRTTSIISEILNKEKYNFKYKVKLEKNSIIYFELEIHSNESRISIINSLLIKLKLVYSSKINPDEDFNFENNISKKGIKLAHKINIENFGLKEVTLNLN